VKRWHHLGNYSLGSVRKSCLVQSTQLRYPLLPPFLSLIHVKTHPVSKIMYSVMSAWWWAKIGHLVLLCIIIPSKFIQNIAELWYISYKTWRDKKVLVEYQTKSAQYSIAHMTQEGLNVLTPIFYNEMFSSPDEMLWCGQLRGLQRVKEMDWGRQNSPWGMLCLRRRHSQISAQI